MGIRFACPNGHHLHVKAYLAGQRGICPDCGAKLRIPNESTQTPTAPVAAPVEFVRDVSSSRLRRQQPPRRQKQTNTAIAEETSPTDDSVVIKTEPVHETTVPTAAENGAPPVAAGPVWYVRPPAGGQFGPADNETIIRWINERRIVPDTFVWCEGWPDWRRAGDESTPLPIPLAGLPAGRSPKPPPTHEPALPIRATNRSRRRSNRLQWVTVLLLVLLVVVLSGVLGWVLLRDPGVAGPV